MRRLTPEETQGPDIGLGDAFEKIRRRGEEADLDPFWKGPKPTAGTMLRLWPMGGKEILTRVPVTLSTLSGRIGSGLIGKLLWG